MTETKRKSWFGLFLDTEERRVGWMLRSVQPPVEPLLSRLQAVARLPYCFDRTLSIFLMERRWRQTKTAISN
jgi:hypothetical protein